MSRSLNKVMLLGNVGSDPEIRATSSGKRVASFSIATNRQWKDNSGEQQKKTEWHRVSCWFEGLVNVVEQWVKKGDRLYVEGRLEYSQTEKDGQVRYWTDIVASEVIMLGSTGGDTSFQGPGESTSSADTPIVEPDDDLPF